MAVLLQLVRGAAGALAVAGLTKGLDFSTDGKEHQLVSYLGFYGGGAIFVLAVVMLTVLIQRRKDPKGSAMADESKPHVTSYNQSGGITAGTVNISAPQPAVHGHVDFVNRRQDDKYLSRIVIRLDAPYAASDLQVQVSGNSIENFDLRPNQAAAMIASTDHGTSANQAVRTIHGPLAPEYLADVVTSQPDALDVAALVR